MSADATYPVPTYTGEDGVPFADTRFTPVVDTTRPEVTVRPWTVVPIVFVPGIMGSNLKAKRQITLPSGGFIKQGERVWDVSGNTTLLNFIGKSAAYRQSVLNHAAVEVDNGGSIDSTTENLGVMGGLAVTPQSRLAVAEARKRGWGSPGWAFYGKFLDWLQYQLSDGRLVNGKPNAVFERIAALAGTTPPHDQKAPSALTDAQTKKLLDIHFPVYAVGYNWLQSNLDSGLDLMQGVGSGAGHVMGINEIIQRYDGVKGQTCKQVIVVTHSMGGLVARAAALAHGGEGKMLGIVHGVQPIDGAAAFYKRIAAGFAGEGSGVLGKLANIGQAQVLGPSAQETIPELAYNPGPLELAPNKRYNGRKPWLFIKDATGKVLKSLPEHGDPYKEIYLDTTHVWRAVNPDWLNPAGAPGDAPAKYAHVVQKASFYHEQLGGKLHPKTYAHWGADADYKSWGDLTWTAEGGQWKSKGSLPGLGSVSRWQPTASASGSDPDQWTFADTGRQSGIGRSVESAQAQGIQMSVDDPSDPGDGTVPAAASGAQIAGYAGCLIGCALKGFKHQNDYNNDAARDVLLDALVRLVEPVEVAD